MKKLIGMLVALSAALPLYAQQPQTQTAPIYAVNAKYANGVAPGYAPTVGTGLALNLGAGTANCSGTIVTYAAGTLTMTASATNYVYLDTSSSCAPAVKTSAFTSSDIPLATVVSGASSITSITDDRTPFNKPSSGGSAGVSSITESAAATGAITFAGAGVAQSGSTFTFSGGAGTTDAYAPVAAIHYGDSITNQAICSSFGIDDNCYPDRLDTAWNISAASNYSISGDQAGDVAPLQILIHDIPALTAQQPVRTLMIGTNDANHAGAGAYEATFNILYNAILSYLTVPSATKVTGGSVFSGGTYTGTCTSDTTYADATGINCTSSGATATFTITTTGGPIYIWFRAIDADTATWTYALNGGSAVSETTALTPAIATQNGGTQSMGYIRIASSTNGANTVVFTKTNGTGNMGILAVGTPSTVFSASQPYLIAGDIPNQLNGNLQTAVNAYVADIHSDIAALQADGLNIKLAHVNSYVQATTAAADMYNTVHPNSGGHGEIAAAFQAAAKVISGVGAFAPSITCTSNCGLFAQVIGATPTLSGTGLTTAYDTNAGFTATNTPSGIRLVDTANAANAEGQVMIYPSSAYTATALFTEPILNASGPAIGMCVTADTTGAGKLTCEFAVGSTILVINYASSGSGTNTTLFSGSYALVPCLWMRIKDDGTNISYQISSDSINWTTLYGPIAKTSTAQSGFYNYLGVTIGHTGNTTLASWSVTNP